MEDIKLIAARNLKRIRNERGISQEELSRLSGVSVRAIVDAECGRKEMKIVTLLKLCEVLMVTANDILYEDVNRQIISYTEQIQDALKFKAFVKESMKDFK